MSSLIAWMADASSTVAGGAFAACRGSCNTATVATAFHNIANTLTFVVGAGSVIMVIIGGFRFVVSRGDPKATVEARNTILYAVIGVGVALSAFAVINFVNVAVR